jgi:putative heme iron utilization protein
MSAERQANLAIARELLAAGGSAALATLAADGSPFVSYVITAAAPDGSPLLLLSRLAQHSRHLDADPRASLLLVRAPPSGGGMAAARLTLTGRARKEHDAALRTAFLARHPEASEYAGFSDFSLFRLDVAGGHLVAGFGRIVSLSREELLLPGQSPED